MIETYAFFAAFVLQIIGLSVLQPIWFAGLWHKEAAVFPADLQPALHERIFRHLPRLRAVNWGIAVFGFALLGAFIVYVPFKAWDDFARFYLMLQCAPMVVATLVFYRAIHEIGSARPEPKRRAVLQRRGLFDFVSPVAVGIAVLCYCLYVAYLFYIARKPFDGFAGVWVNVAGMTLTYLVGTVVAWRALYGKKTHAFETHEGRINGMHLAVRMMVFMCIFSAVGLSLDLTIKYFELDRWIPFMSCAGMALLPVMFYLTIKAPPRGPDAGRPDPVGPPTPHARGSSA
jgi:hypothetical protein